MMDIPIPPQPLLDDSLAYGIAAGCVVVGVLLACWGRTLSRPLTGAGGAALGLLLAAPVATKLSVDLVVARVALATLLGVLGFVVAPFVWTLLTAVACVSVAWVVLVQEHLAAPEQVSQMEGAAESVEQWLVAFFRDGVWPVTKKLWNAQWGTALMVLCPAALIPLMIGLWKPKFLTSLMTSLIGALGIVAGAMLALAQYKESLWPTTWAGFYAPLGAAGLLAIGALAYQYNRFIVADRKKKAAKEGDEGSKKSGKGR